jgi:uracil-DNA glycosylase
MTDSIAGTASSHHSLRESLQTEELAVLKAIIALGRIAHDSLVRALGRKVKDLPFVHGGEHLLANVGARGLALFDCYHCSRYNTNTGVLTPAMFREVFGKACARIGVQRGG